MDSNTAALRAHEAREEQRDRDYAARLERAKGYVAMGFWEIDTLTDWLKEHETFCEYLQIAIAHGDHLEAGRMLHEAAVEAVARELEDD